MLGNDQMYANYETKVLKEEDLETQDDMNLSTCEDDAFFDVDID